MISDQLNLEVDSSPAFHWVEYKSKRRRFGVWVVGKRWTGACFNEQEKALKFYEFVKKKEKE